MIDLTAIHCKSVSLRVFVESRDQSQTTGWAKLLENLANAFPMPNGILAVFHWDAGRDSFSSAQRFADTIGTMGASAKPVLVDAQFALPMGKCAFLFKLPMEMGSIGDQMFAVKGIELYAMNPSEPWSVLSIEMRYDKDPIRPTQPDHYLMNVLGMGTTKTPAEFLSDVYGFLRSTLERFTRVKP